MTGILHPTRSPAGLWPSAPAKCLERFVLCFLSPEDVDVHIIGKMMLWNLKKKTSLARLCLSSLAGAWRGETTNQQLLVALAETHFFLSSQAPG